MLAGAAAALQCQLQLILVATAQAAWSRWHCTRCASPSVLRQPCCSQAGGGGGDETLSGGERATVAPSLSFSAATTDSSRLFRRDYSTSQPANADQ